MQHFPHTTEGPWPNPPPPVHNYYGPYAYCSLDKGVACAQHIQLPTHVLKLTIQDLWDASDKKKFLVHQQGATCAEIG